MKVAVLSDHTIDTRPGGATRLLQNLLGHAPDDLSISILTPTVIDYGIVDDADLVITYLMKRFPKEAYEAVLRHPRHVRHEIDWWHDGEGNEEYRKLLNEQARLVMFVSPLQQERFKRLYDIHPQQELLVPCAMDVAGIRSHILPEEQRSGVMWCGEWSMFKGLDLAARWAKDNQTYVDFYSPSMQKSNPVDYCNFIGYVPEATWYDNMASHAKLIHFARVPDAFNYSILEAYILGLEVEVTGNIGAESYGDIDALIERCATSYNEFWDAALSA